MRSRSRRCAVAQAATAPAPRAAAGGGVAVGGSLRHHLRHDRRQRRRHVRAQRADRLRRARAVGVELAQHRVAGEGHAAGEQVVERAAEGVDVGADVGGAGVLGLLRGDVVRRADDHVGAGQAASVSDADGERGQAEVEDLRRRRPAVSIRLCGLTSRWTSPWSWACCKPSGGVARDAARLGRPAAGRRSPDARPGCRPRRTP